MQEREFQNIFTFSPGFEAATLKYPSGSRPREPAAALLAELQQLAAQQDHALNLASDPHALDEAISALQLSATGASSSSSTTPSAAISLTPSAPSGPLLTNATLPPIPTRRQTIGFARFKSRPDALAAKEHLQGRKIDHITGATLKAEMAKKNLHTKRNTGEELMGMLLRSGRLAGLVNAAGQVQQAQQAQQAPTMGFPQPIPSSREVMSIPLSYTAPTAKEAWDAWNPISVPLPMQDKDSSSDRASMSGGSLRDKEFFGPASIPTSSSIPRDGPLGPQPTASTQSGSPPSTTSVKSPPTRPTDSRALLALAEEADELEGWSVGSMGVNMGGLEGPTGYTPRKGPGASASTTAALSTSAGAQGFVAMANQSAAAGFGSSPPAGAFAAAGIVAQDGRGGVNTNPADQNPPVSISLIRSWYPYCSRAADQHPIRR